MYYFNEEGQKRIREGINLLELQPSMAVTGSKDANRQLDCWVMRHVHEMYKQFGLPAYDTIRSPFHEGVCNPAMIMSYFLPRPVGRFNPYIK